MYYAVHKPFNVLSQFTKEAGNISLKDIFPTLPNDVYPVGRLDKDSEGLLLLTNDPKVNKALLHPSNKHTKTYLIQVEGAPTEADLKKVEKPILITVDGKPYHTMPAKAWLYENEENIPERSTPIRFRQNIPTTWIALELTEGKNRQVRKMTAAIGFPTLRLIRYKIEDMELEHFEPGTIKIYDQKTFYLLLNL